MSGDPLFQQRLYRDLHDDGSVTLTARVDGARLGFRFHSTQAAELRRFYDVHGTTAPTTEAYEQGLYQGVLGCQTKGVTAITRFGETGAPTLERDGYTAARLGD